MKDVAMKKLLLFTLLTATLLSCGKDDDLQSSVDDLRSRVTTIEGQLSTLNFDIASLRALVSALQSEDHIVSVTELPDKSGYILQFSKTGVIVIKHGKDGSDGDSSSVPIIGVDESEGVYYWTATINGTKTWLLDKNGSKLCVTGIDGSDGYDGKTPVLGVDAEGYWTIDKGDGNGVQRLKDANNKDVKAAGNNEGTSGSLFSSVVDEGQYVLFTLTGGTSFLVPVLQPLAISFTEGTSFKFNDKETAVVNYTITGSSTTYTITAYAGGSILLENGHGYAALSPYYVELSRQTATTGQIRIYNNSSFEWDWNITGGLSKMESQIIVWISDGKNTILSTIDVSRKKFFDGYSVQVNTPGTLLDKFTQYYKPSVQSLAISGALNESDISFLWHSFPLLRSLDITNTHFPNNQISEESFYGCIQSLKLPSIITAIGDYAFSSSELIEDLVIPGSVSMIGSDAFGFGAPVKVYCKALSPPILNEDRPFSILYDCETYPPKLPYLGVPIGRYTAYALSPWASLFETIEEVAF